MTPLAIAIFLVGRLDRHYVRQRGGEIQTEPAPILTSGLPLLK
jgi:hypothetical protein